MKRLIIFLIFTGLSSCMQAQTSGYIRKGDSYISGYLYPQTGVRSNMSCKFSLDKKSEIKTYTPDQVNVYSYGNYTYVSLKIKSGNDSVKMFLEAIVQGDNPVYYLNETSGERFYIVNTKKELVELTENDGEYKHQLAAYYNSPATTIPGIHTAFTRNGIIRTVKIFKEATLANVYNATESVKPEQKLRSIKQKKWLLMKKPVASVSLQSGVTFQRMPLDLQAGLPAGWDLIKASGLTYSLALDFPILKYWPVTYHQEIGFNKFVTDYRQGADPPDSQLIQDFSVISLPSMLRYTLGRKNLTGYINTGLQLDIALNKNNIGWLKLDGNSVSGYDGTAIEYLNYSKFQPGITAGFGIAYKLNKVFELNSEFRYSGIFNVLSDKAGTESQYTLKVGVTYKFFKKEKTQ